MAHDLTDLLNKVENYGATAAGRLSANEWNRLIQAVIDHEDALYKWENGTAIFHAVLDSENHLVSGGDVDWDAIEHAYDVGAGVKILVTWQGEEYPGIVLPLMSFDGDVFRFAAFSQRKLYVVEYSAFPTTFTFLAFTMATSITSGSTDNETPTSKAVWDCVQTVFAQTINATAAATSAAVLANSAAAAADAAASAATDALAVVAPALEALEDAAPVINAVLEDGPAIIRAATAIKTVSYTADFRENQDTVVVVNMDGDITITEIVAVNVATLKLTHGSTLQQSVTPGSGLSIQVSAGESCIWEITRTTEGSRAYIGVKSTPDEFLPSEEESENE